MKFPYRFAWKNNESRARLYGRRCRILARGAKNTVLIEFENGEMVTTSGNALRKAEPRLKKPAYGHFLIFHA